MIIDLQKEDLGSQIDADVCIVGAGPAGISLALELANKDSKLSIVLLESGGEGYEVETQNLYIGDNTGRDYFPLNITRLRQLGGSTGHWSGWCAPFNEIDFETRDWINGASWPIDYKELKNHYARANEILGLGPAHYEPAELSAYLSDFQSMLDESIVSRVWHFSKPPVRFGTRFKSQLDEHKTVKLILHANLINIDLVDNLDSVKSVQVSTLDGSKQSNVSAKHFVLACGGIENARILLNSNQQLPEGVGNQNDLVGRFFMEHIEVECGTIHDADLRLLSKFKNFSIGAGYPVGGSLCPSPDYQKAKQIGNCAAYFRAQSMTAGANGWYDLLAATKQLSKAKIPEKLGSKVMSIVKDIDLILNVVSLKALKQPLTSIAQPDGQVKVISMAEQVPNRNSRILLTDERDVLGKQKIAMNWELTRKDYQTVRETMLAIASSLAGAGKGRMKLADWLADDSGEWPSDTHGGHHHMGTTRMARDETDGVVDRDCKVFGIDNLFVCSSSVFPTGGYANPTLSIVAMAIRLSDRLSHKDGN